TYFREKKVDDRTVETDYFIADMHTKTQKIIIPMNLSAEGKSEGHMGLHWHLLVYDIKNYQWEHYNSLKEG
ncbi:hypothetical protein MKX03_015258, partial [Papaver bracteatum]